MAKQSVGTCQLCGHQTTKGAMVRHIRKCAAAHDSAKGHPGTLVHLRVEAADAPHYWLDVEIKAGATLEKLDEFLRDTWLECCGHMSEFQIGDRHYVMPYETGFSIFEHEAHMHVPVAKALSLGERAMAYQYDFGSTTYLKLRVMGEREGRIGRRPLRLIAQNDAAEWKCAECDRSAVVLCVMCMYDTYPFLCRKHAQEHQCEGEGDYFLPVVNSPRMGVCAYTGQEEWHGI